MAAGSRPVAAARPAAADDRDVLVTRVFDAPRALVYEAWTRREHIVEWWKPKGFERVVVDQFEPQAGGRFGVSLYAPGGDVYTSRCVFRELKGPERIAYDEECFENGQLFHRAQYTVVFEEQGGRTLLTVKARLDWVEGRNPRWTKELMREGWTSGWKDNFSELESYLARCAR